MSIELRLSNVNPPTPEPSRTMYRDIVNLPDPVLLSITAHFYNHDSVGLYFQITGSGIGYTFGTVNLGLLAAGKDALQNLDQLGSRAKPSASALLSGEMDENITLTLNAYTDSGYSNLKWTFNRTVDVHWINSADPAFTVNNLDNFDDGTVDGWEAVAQLNCTVSLAIATDYVLSPPYSLKNSVSSSSGGEVTSRINKSFNTPNKSKVFAIIDCRMDIAFAARFIVNLTVETDSTVLVYLGQPYGTVATSAVPLQKWIRIVVPLTPNATVDIRLVEDGYAPTGPGACFNFWMDDFKLISK